jgi:hypothetical protein
VPAGGVAAEAENEDIKRNNEDTKRNNTHERKRTEEGMSLLLCQPLQHSVALGGGRADSAPPAANRSWRPPPGASDYRIGAGTFDNAARAYLRMPEPIRNPVNADAT